MIRPAWTLVLLLAALQAGCAGRAVVPRADGPSRAAREGLEAWLDGADAPRAAARLDAALAADPADPWALLGQAVLARRALDGEGEVAALGRLVAAAPGSPLALVALRRLADLTEGSPEAGRAVEAALRPLERSGALAGLAAFRARVARLAAADTRGDAAEVARLRAENGAVTAWSLAGPFGALHALDFERPFPPEEGSWPAEAAVALQGAPRPTRPLPTPDGLVTLEGEPMDGDVFYLAADVALARGGRYLAVLGGAPSLRAWVDGAPLAERRAFAAPTSSQRAVPVTLAAGRHTLLVKVARGGSRLALVVTLAREDGTATDALWSPRAAGPLPRTAAGSFPAGLGGGAELAAALEPGGPALARLLAARDVLGTDDETAKALLEAALALRPEAAPLLAARGLAHAADATLDEQIGRSRAERALRAALTRDAGDGEARLALADLLRRSDRAPDAADLLAAAPTSQQRAGPLLAARARVALDRNLPEQAEALAEAARTDGGSCEALRLLADQAARRDAVQREAQLVQALASGCRGGRERLFRLLEQRGDRAGALALLEPVVRTRPAAIGPAVQRAGVVAAQGGHAAAAAALAPLVGIWPRSVAVLKASADQLELAGDRAGARALRERALRVDGSDLALRRALALEDGGEPLSDVAVDGAAVLRAYRAEPPREEAGTALVLDAAAAELHPGGAVTERIHQIIRVLSQEAVDQYGEAPVPPGAQLLRLRTLKPDGRVLEPEGGDGKGATSLSGLEPGDAVELEFLQATRAPNPRLAPAADRFYFETPGASMYLSTYLARAPAGLGLEVDAHGLLPPAIERRGAWDVATVERRRVPPLVPEPGAPPSQEQIPFVQFGAGPGASGVPLVVADALAGRAAPTLELRALAAEVRAAAGAGGPEALARAAYARVRALVVGQGGSFTEDASVVLSRGRGSRLALLKGLLDALGIPARLAIVRPPASDQTAYRFPRPGLWSGQLLRITVPGKVLWLDPTVRQMPFGGLPEPLLDAEAILLPAPGEAPEVVRTPAAPVLPDGRELDLSVALAADGSATVSGADRYLGAQGAILKVAFERMNAQSRRQAVEQFLARTIRGLTIRELTVEGEDDPDAPFTIRWTGAVPALARAAEGGLELDGLQPQLRLGARFVQLAARRTPLLLSERERTVLRLTVTPPPGLAPPPSGPPRRVESPSGRFTRTETSQGGAWRREDRLELERGRVAPEAYPAFAAFCGAVDEVEARPVLFRP